MTDDSQDSCKISANVRIFRALCRYIQSESDDSEDGRLFFNVSFFKMIYFFTPKSKYMIEFFQENMVNLTQSPLMEKPLSKLKRNATKMFWFCPTPVDLTDVPWLIHDFGELGIRSR